MNILGEARLWLVDQIVSAFTLAVGQEVIRSKDMVPLSSVVALELSLYESLGLSTLNIYPRGKAWQCNKRDGHDGLYSQSKKKQHRLV